MAEYDLRNDPLEERERVARRSLRAAHAGTAAPAARRARLRRALLRRAGGERILQEQGTPAPWMARRRGAGNRQPRPAAGRMANQPLRRSGQNLRPTPRPARLT